MPAQRQGGIQPSPSVLISPSSSTRQSSPRKRGSHAPSSALARILILPSRHRSPGLLPLPPITKHPTPPLPSSQRAQHPSSEPMARKNAQVISSSYATNDDLFPSSSASSSSASSVTRSPNSPPAAPPVSNQDMQASSVLQAPIQSTLDMTEQGYSEKLLLKDEQSAGGGANELHRRTAGTGGGEERKRRVSMPARTMSKNPRVFEGSQGLLSKVILSGRDRRSFLLLILLCESWLYLLRS